MNDVFLDACQGHFDALPDNIVDRNKVQSSVRVRQHLEGMGLQERAESIPHYFLKSDNLLHHPVHAGKTCCGKRLAVADADTGPPNTGSGIRCSRAQAPHPKTPTLTP